MENLKAIVLAAGKGTRLQIGDSDMPKVMRPALGNPLLRYVLDAIDFISPENTTIVVGYRKEKIIEHFPGYNFAVQSEQLGTGHAVLAAEEALQNDSTVLVCCGDMPLIEKSTFNDLLNTHFRQRNTCTLLSGTSDLNLPYGRIVRDKHGNFETIVEEKDCTPDQLAIKELNIGVYVFNSSALLVGLKELRNDNAQREYYLTDVPAILKAKGEIIGLCARDMGHEIIGVNTGEQLAQVEEILSRRSD